MTLKGYVYLYPIVFVKVEVDPALTDQEMIEQAEEKADLYQCLSRQIPGAEQTEWTENYESFGVERVEDGKDPVTIWYEPDGETIMKEGS